MTPAEKTLARWRREAKPPRPIPGSARSRNARKVAMAQAFAQWSDLDEVVRIYIACAVMNELFPGHCYCVDHIVPIWGVGERVRGLHVHTNLQVITRKENKAKGNWVWPGMPAMTYEAITGG